MSDPFWYSQVNILYKRPYEFWPNSQMSIYEKCNAFTRFILYAGILLSIYSKNFVYLVMGLALIAFLAITVNSKELPSEFYNKTDNSLYPDTKTMISQKCQKPTSDNPFANVLITDYSQNPTRDPACSSSDSSIQKDIKSAFFNDFTQDPFDVFNRKHNQRQFFSTANTKIPNDQDSYAQWLYGNPNPTCKEKALMCKGNEAFS